MAIQSLSGAGGQTVVNVPAGVPQNAAPTQPAPAVQQPVPPQQKPEPSHEQVQQALKEVQQKVQVQANSLQFSLDKETGQTIVKVTDAATGDVIRQIPAEEMVAIAQAIDQYQGLLLKQKA